MSPTPRITTSAPLSLSTDIVQNVPVPVNVTYLPAFDECGLSSVTQSDDRIVNGLNSTLHAWPWIAALGYRVRAKRRGI